MAGLALDAGRIRRKPVAVAAAAAAAMKRAVARGLVAACDRLPVIVAEGAGDARHLSGVVHRAKRVIKLQLEAAIHASDDIVLERHAGPLRRDRIFPGEVSDDVLVTVLMTVRVLPFFVTVALTRAFTLFVSTLGVRWYNTQT